MDTVFVGNLSFFCSQDDLVRLFSPHVSIRSAAIVKTKEGQTCYYGFVYLEKEEDAQRVLELFDGMKFLGRNIKIGIRSNEAAKQVVDGSTVQMFVRFLSEKRNDDINEATLDSVFSKFGAVADCIIKEYTRFDATPPVQSGYAFVHVFQLDTAQDIIRRLNSEEGKEIDDISFKVSLSHQCSERLHTSSDFEENSSFTRKTTNKPINKASHAYYAAKEFSGSKVDKIKGPNNRNTSNPRFHHGRTSNGAPRSATSYTPSEPPSNLQNASQPNSGFISHGEYSATSASPSAEHHMHSPSNNNQSPSYPPFPYATTNVNNPGRNMPIPAMNPMLTDGGWPYPTGVSSSNAQYFPTQNFPPSPSVVMPNMGPNVVYQNPSLSPNVPSPYTGPQASSASTPMMISNFQPPGFMSSVPFHSGQYPMQYFSQPPIYPPPYPYVEGMPPPENQGFPHFQHPQQTYYQYPQFQPQHQQQQPPPSQSQQPQHQFQDPRHGGA